MTKDRVAAGPEEQGEPSPSEATPGRALRRRALIGAIVAGLAVLAVGIVVGSWLTPAARAQHALANAFGTIRSADSVVLGVDDVVRSEITPELGPKARALGQHVPGTLDGLRSSLTELKDSRDRLSGRDGQMADALIASARERITMLEAAGDILTASERVSSALQPTQDAWGLIADAAKVSDQAALAYDTHTRSGVETSTRLTKDASQKLVSAEQTLIAVERMLPEADLSALHNYATLRRKLASESMRIDTAWLAGDIDRANRLLDSYIVDQTALTPLARKLPRNETAPIAKAYEVLAGAATVRYQAARTRAVEADTRVRSLQEGQPST